MSRLPRILELAANAGGAEAVIRLVKAFGGKTINIPRRAGKHTAIVRAGGQRAAHAICEEYGNSTVRFPKGGKADILRRLLAAEALAEGCSLNQAVERSGLSCKSVERLRKRLAAGEPIVEGMDWRPAERVRRSDPRQIDIEDYLKERHNAGS